MKNPAAHERGPQASVPTVAEVCERHIAEQPNPRTAATYRSRLRPLMRHCGELAAPEALLRLAELERDLEDDGGSKRAHKAVTLLQRALRDAGFRLLTSVDATSKHKIAIRSLHRLVETEQVRYRYRRRHGRSESILFDPDELAEDLGRLPRCPVPGCDQPGTGASGYCGEHFGRGGRHRAREAERKILDDDRDWLTFTEAVRESGASPGTITKAINDGGLPSARTGRLRRVARVGFGSWLATRSPVPDTAGLRITPKARRKHLDHTIKLHAMGTSVGVIGEQLGVSKPTVYSYLDELGLERAGKGRQSRRLPPAERTRRERRTAELYNTGGSLKNVAAKNDSSATQVRRDLAKAKRAGIPGAEIRPPGRLPKYAPPTERPCEWCGKRFKPPSPAADTRGGQPRPRRFHSDECARAWRTAQARVALDQSGLLSAKAAGAAIGVGEHRVVDLVDRGLLRSELVAYPGMLRPVHGIAPEELRRFLRKWALEGDGRRASALNPGHEIARAEGDGRIDRLVSKLEITRDEAYDLICMRVKRRRQTLARHRKGPRPTAGPCGRDLRWLERFLELRDEVAYHNEQLELKLVDKQDGERYRETLAGARRSDYRLAMEIAGRDWREHPEDWPRDGYPPATGKPDVLRADLRRPAAEKVLKAVHKAENRLQTARTEIPAA